MNKIGIFGIGSIGSILAKYLMQNKSNQLFYFNRSPKKELQIQFNAAFFRQGISISNETDLSLDWIIICLKEYQIKDALPSIQKIISINTKIVLFQNGLQISKPYLGLVKAENILETIIDCPIQKDSEGSLIQLGVPKIILPANPLARAFSSLIDHIDVSVMEDEQFKTQQWKKIIESSSLGSVQSLQKETCKIFKEEIHLQGYLELVKEGIQIARAEGIVLESSFEDELKYKLKQYPDEKGSSMLSDILSNKPIELDAKIGILAKIAKKHNLNIPQTNLVYHKLLHHNKALENHS